MYLFLFSGNTWVMLNNLNPSTDSSMLRTLCMQHGQLAAFQCLLHQGVALVRYNSYEEAAKAQGGLNNMTLGATTVRAEFVSDSDVQAFLGGSGVQTQQSWSSGTSMSRVSLC